MALTDAQKVSILSHLGYPYLPWTLALLNTQLAIIAALPTASAMEAKIGTYITAMDATDTKRSSFLSSSAGKQVDGTTGDAYYQGEVLVECDRERSYYARLLSRLLDIPLGDNFSFFTTRLIQS
jgi:hypothetical protein